MNPPTGSGRCCGKDANPAQVYFSSADLEELLFYADRIMVFYSGRVSEPIPVGNLDEIRLGAMIGGKEWASL